MVATPSEKRTGTASAAAETAFQRMPLGESCLTERSVFSVSRFYFLELFSVRSLEGSAHGIRFNRDLPPNIPMSGSPRLG